MSKKIMEYRWGALYNLGEFSSLEQEILNYLHRKVFWDSYTRAWNLQVLFLIAVQCENVEKAETYFTEYKEEVCHIKISLRRHRREEEIPLMRAYIIYLYGNVIPIKEWLIRTENEKREKTNHKPKGKDTLIGFVSNAYMWGMIEMTEGKMDSAREHFEIVTEKGNKLFLVKQARAQLAKMKRIAAGREDERKESGYI